MADDTTDSGVSYVHISGQYHIVVLLQSTDTEEAFDWDKKDCTDGWGYLLIGEGY